MTNKVNYKNLNDISIMDLSKRTISKIIERSGKGCSICDWNLTRCDIHHIIERSNGGSNELDNLILICPNCHRAIHTLGDIYITEHELKDKSLKYTFSDWKIYYNPSTKDRLTFNKNAKVKKCMNKDCQEYIPMYNNYCSSICYNTSKLYNKKYNRFDWDDEKLKTLLKEHNSNLTKIGKILGVSDNAIRKHCKKVGIEIKKIKYKNIRPKIDYKRNELSEDDIKFIKENYKERDSNLGTRGLGRKFGVDHSVISCIVNNKTYKSIS